MVKTESIPCRECLAERRRPYRVAVVRYDDRGYDVWRVARLRRPILLPGPWFETPGTVYRRAQPGERVKCRRNHRGRPGVIVLDDATVADALDRALAPPGLRRVVMDPPRYGVEPDLSDPDLRRGPDDDPDPPPEWLDDPDLS